MLFAITWQWVTEITLVLCLFGAACIGVAVGAGGGDRDPVGAQQKITERKSTSRHDDAQRPFV